MNNLYNLRLVLKINVIIIGASLSQPHTSRTSVHSRYLCSGRPPVYYRGLTRYFVYSTLPTGSLFSGRIPSLIVAYPIQPRACTCIMCLKSAGTSDGPPCLSETAEHTEERLRNRRVRDISAAQTATETAEKRAARDYIITSMLPCL